MASTPNTPANPPAGWFPDPWGVAEMRYWDGAQWTAHVHPPAAQPAAPAAPPAAPAPVAATPSVGAPPGTGAPITTIPIATPAAEEPKSAEERRKQLLTIALGVAILIAIVVAILRIAGGSSSSSASTPVAPEPTAATPTPTATAPKPAHHHAAVAKHVATTKPVAHHAKHVAHQAKPAAHPAKKLPTLAEVRAKEQSQEQASDSKAEEAAHTAQVAMEVYATEHGGSYVGATIAELQSIEPTVSSQNLTIAGVGEKTYTIAVTSARGDKFEVDHSMPERYEYVCTPPGHGSCPANGVWH
jgi:hypothetical protein